MNDSDQGNQAFTDNMHQTRPIKFRWFRRPIFAGVAQECPKATAQSPAS